MPKISYIGKIANMMEPSYSSLNEWFADLPEVLTEQGTIQVDNEGKVYFPYGSDENKGVSNE